MILLLFLENKAYCQTIDPSNLILEEENWLPKRTINCVFQDSRGFLWVGAKSGLYRYDGYEVLYFTTQPNNNHAIFTNTVTSLAELKNGNLLVGTESGLSVFDIKTHYFETISPEIDLYNVFPKGDDGNVWLSLHRKELFKVILSDKAKIELVPLKQSNENLPIETGVIKAFLPLSNNVILIGTQYGLFIVDTKTGNLQKTSMAFPVSSIVKSSSKEILVGTEGSGVYELAILNNQVSVLNRYHFGKLGDPNYDKVSSISINKNGNCVVSTINQVFLSTKNNKGRSFVAFETNSPFLIDNNIQNTHIDKAGTIWLGTLKGLLKIRQRAIKVERVPLFVTNFMPSNQVVTYLQSDLKNHFWVKTRNDGIFSFDINSKKFSKTTLPGDLNNFFLSTDGYTYFTNTEGLHKLANNVSSLVYAAKNDINYGIEIEKGEWFLGCLKNGLEYYSSSNSQKYSGIIAKANEYFSQYSNVFVMLKDKVNNVWVGSKGDGLLRINISTGIVKKYSGIKLKEGAISRRILCIYEDSKGLIWIGSRTGGLYRYNPKDDNFTQFTVKNGLPSDVVCGIIEDKNNELIVSTDNGLAVLMNNEPIPFQSFGISDGIDYTDFSFNAVTKDASGEVYFGNTNGLYKVNLIPKFKKEKINFYWNSLHVLGKDSATIYRLFENQNILLKSDENSFEVRFSFTDLSNPTKNRFAYRLFGSHNQEWVYDNTSSQKIQLLSVPAGDYVLELKTANSLGQWNDQVMKLEFTISPPFYLSRMAYFFYFVLSILFFYFLIIAFRRWKNLNKTLIDEKALGAIKDQQMVYFSDMSHELKNRLTLILGPLENALLGKKVNQGVLKNLYEQAQRLKRITEQIMKIRKNDGGEFVLKVSEGNLYLKLLEICQDTEPLALIRAIKLEYHFDENLTKVWFDEELLEIMLLNLLNNAIKFNKPNGKVKIQGSLVLFSESNLPQEGLPPGAYLKCDVKDSGVGIPDNEIEHIFKRFYRATNSSSEKDGVGIGLELISRLIKKHKGFIEIKSVINEGTHISFFIPLEKKHFQISELKVSVNTMPIFEVLGDQNKSDEKFKPLILIVDDDPDIINLLFETLSDDFRVNSAGDGQMALELISKNDYSLVISDLTMPKIDGLELLKSVKGNPLWNHIPFIILTGRNSESQKLICIQNEADDFIDKPFNPILIKWKAKSMINNQTRLEKKFSKKLNFNPDESLIRSPEEDFLQKVVGIIEANIVEPKLSVEFLAEECSMSRATFYRKVESMLGESPSDFIRTYRLKKAAQLLKNTNLYISEVAYQTGFRNPKYFTQVFQKEFGTTPTDYVKNIKSD